MKHNLLQVIYDVVREGSRVKPAYFLSFVVLVSLAASSWAQTQPQAQPPVRTQPPDQTQPQASEKKNLSPEEIIRQFSAKETEFYDAWKEYAYKQTAEILVLSVNGVPKRERMTIISEIVFKDNGTREVNIIRRNDNLRSVAFTREDEEVINNLQPFALTSKEMTFYNLAYEGKEKVDELTCYVFSVKPKSTKGNKIYFEGKIWVDDQDLQVVRTVGRPVPQKKNNLFPDFETIRQMIDNKYWFPVWTHANSQLRFSNETVGIEETITYEDYKHFGSKATIQFGPPKP
jgi:hypothetical protein